MLEIDCEAHLLEGYGVAGLTVLSFPGSKYLGNLPVQGTGA